MNTVTDKTEKFGWLPLVALGLIIGLIPTIIYLRVVNYEGVLRELYGRPNSANFFTFYKAVWLYILAGAAMLWHLVNRSAEPCWYHRPLVAYSFMAILSTIFSQHPKLAFFGETDRHEGLMAHLCYMAITFLAINAVKNKRHIKFLLGCLLLSATVLSVAGVFQFLGYDFFYSNFTDTYLVPDYVRKIAPDFKVATLTPVPDAIFLTFGNSNFTGSYMTMLFALTLALATGLQSRHKYWCIILNLLLFVNLLGCKSRAGMLGAAVATFLLLIFNRHRLRQQIGLLALLAFFYIAIGYAMSTYAKQTEHHKTKLIKSAITPARSIFGNFEDLQLHQNEAIVVFDGLMLKIRYNDTQIDFYDRNDRIVPHRLVKKSDYENCHNAESATAGLSKSITTNAATASLLQPPASSTQKASDSSNIAITGKESDAYLVLFPKNLMRGYVILAWPDQNLLQIGRGGETFFMAYMKNGFQLLDQRGRPAIIEHIDTFGFDGKEKFASGRGYIWSRSIPMLKKTLFIGFGPDTYAAHFPNHDYLGKLRHVLSGIQRIIDKPHNMYLQIAINTGVISLLAILALLGVYLRESCHLYWQYLPDSTLQTAGLGISLSIIAYLVAGIFNDSVNSVAPVFWSLLGIGISTNRISSAEFNRGSKNKR